MIRRNRRPPVLPAILLLGLAGCATTLDASNLGVPVTLASSAIAPPQGAAFRVHTHATFAFWGLVPISRFSLERSLATQLVGGNRIENIRVTVKSRWKDLLFTVLSGGLVVPRSVIIEGVVVGTPADSTPPAQP